MTNKDDLPKNSAASSAEGQEEKEIKRQVGMLKSLLDSIPDIIFFKDMEGVYLGCNPPFAEFVGKPRESIVGQTDYGLFAKEIADFFRKHDRRMLELRESRHNEEWITYPDGRKKLIDTLKTPYWGPDGKLIGILGVSRDITERKQSEEALKQLSARLALAARAGGVGVWDYDIANNSLLWDDQMYALYGITKNDFGGAYESWKAGLHPGDLARGDDEIQSAIRGEKEFNTEFRVVWPDGSVHNIRALAITQRDDAGKPLRMIGTNWDITVQKRTEEALLESSANFRTFFESMTDMIMVGSPDGRLIFTNPAVTQVLGYSAQELSMMHVLELHEADKRQEAETIFADMFRGARSSCPLPLVAKSGELIPVETRVWFGKWDGADCIFGISKNLTAEQEAAQRFERLFRNNPTLMALSILPDQRFTDVNNSFLQTLGYSREDIIGKTSADLGLFVHPEHQSVIAKELLEKRRFENMELQVRRKDGAIIHGLFSGEIISSQGRQYFLTVMIDITKRKLAEAALKESSLYARQLIEASLDPLVTISSEGKITDANSATEAVTGIGREKLIGSDFSDYFTDPERARAGYSEAFKHGKVIDWPLTFRHISGVITEVLYNAAVYRNEQGEVIGIYAAARDITESKRITAKLASLSIIQRELTRLATDFINIPLERQDEAMDKSLATLGRLIKADRAYLFAYDFSVGVVRNTYEWYKDGLIAEIDNLQAVPDNFVPGSEFALPRGKQEARIAFCPADVVRAHQRGKSINIPSVAGLPADSGLRRTLEPQGIRSFITIPLMQNRVCTGFVGFDTLNEEQIWGEEELALLRVLAELYSHFAARRAADRATRELQKELTHALDIAQAATVSKTLFLANMSHEIRTPLNVILGYAQIMERECRTCPVKNRLGVITKSGEHLLKLITNLLELVRSDASVITLAPCNFDFYQMLEDVRLMFTTHPELTLDISHTPDVPNFIYADPGRIRQVLVNLLGNAVKFTKQGGIRLSASVAAGGTPDSVMIAVDIEDTGCGIRGEDLERIFKIFELAGESRKRGQSTGLGLPLSLRYAQALGGGVTVTSTFGKGSCFRFTFKARTVSGAGGKLPGKGSVLKLASGQRVYRLLAVDDDQANIDLLFDMLAPAGFKVESASDAEQALRRLRRTKEAIDILLMDKRMPGMDGYDTIAHIRKLPGGNKLPVLVVTASGLANEKELAFAAGADGYIPKPVRREQLLEEIGRLTGALYEYEQAPHGAAAPAALKPGALAGLPEEQKHSLRQALLHGDIRRLREIAEAIGRDNAGLAAGILALAETYDYDRLRQMIDASQGEKT